MSISKPRPPADLMLYFAPCFAKLRVSLLIFTWKCHMQLKCPKWDLTSHPSTCSPSYNSFLEEWLQCLTKGQSQSLGIIQFSLLSTCSLMVVHRPVCPVPAHGLSTCHSAHCHQSESSKTPSNQSTSIQIFQTPYVSARKSIWSDYL